MCLVSFFLHQSLVVNTKLLLYTQKQILRRRPGGNNQEKKCVRRHGLLTNFVILQIEGNFEVYPSKTINAWAVLSLSILTLLKDRKSRMQNMVS